MPWTSDSILYLIRQAIEKGLEWMNSFSFLGLPLSKWALWSFCAYTALRFVLLPLLGDGFGAWGTGVEYVQEKAAEKTHRRVGF